MGLWHVSIFWAILNSHIMLPLGTNLVLLVLHEIRLVGFSFFPQRECLTVLPNENTAFVLVIHINLVSNLWISLIAMREISITVLVITVHFVAKFLIDLIHLLHPKLYSILVGVVLCLTSQSLVL